MSISSGIGRQVPPKPISTRLGPTLPNFPPQMVEPNFPPQTSLPVQTPFQVPVQVPLAPQPQGIMQKTIRLPFVLLIAAISIGIGAFGYATYLEYKRRNPSNEE